MSKAREGRSAGSTRGEVGQGGDHSCSAAGLELGLRGMEGETTSAVSLPASLQQWPVGFHGVGCATAGGSDKAIAGIGVLKDMARIFYGIHQRQGQKGERGSAADILLQRWAAGFGEMEGKVK